ncbi:MAG: hypothetical protein AB1716_00265 [Planctomycetota bacterium]
MRTLRTALVAGLAALFVLGGGCRTEQTKKIIEVERTGDQVKVKKIETHKDKHGTTKKIETKEYEDD